MMLAIGAVDEHVSTLLTAVVRCATTLGRGEDVRASVLLPETDC